MPIGQPAHLRPAPLGAGTKEDPPSSTPLAEWTMSCQHAYAPTHKSPRMLAYRPSRCSFNKGAPEVAQEHDETIASPRASRAACDDQRATGHNVPTRTAHSTQPCAI